MNKYLKKIIILVILLLGYILFIGGYKIEFKKQINDGNIKISINNFLTDFFSLKNSQLSGNELIKEFYEKVDKILWKYDYVININKSNIEIC